MIPRGTQPASLRRCAPVGSIADAPNVLAGAIKARMKLSRGTDGNLTVFVAGGNVYATRATSSVSDTVGERELVGTYTYTARPVDIAEDIEAWRAAA